MDNVLTLEQARAKYASERGISAELDAANLELVKQAEEREAPVAEAPTKEAETSSPKPGKK